MKIRSDDYYVSKTRRWQTRAIAFFVMAVLVVPIMHRIILEALGNEYVTADVLEIMNDSAMVEFDNDGVNSVLLLEKDKIPGVFFVGQKIVLYAPRINWGAIDTHNARMSPYGMIASCICLILGIACAVTYFKWRKEQKYNLGQIRDVKTNGEKLSCKIEKVERISKLARIHLITLTHTDLSGRTRTFLSDTLYFDPTKFFRGKEYLDVYVDRNDDERYVIDYPDDFPNNGAFHYF